MHDEAGSCLQKWIIRLKLMDAFLTFVWQLGNFSSSIYAENCIFEDPTIKFRGKNYRLLPTATCMLLFLLCLAWPFFSSSACPSSTTQVTHIAVTGKKKHERKENITLKMYNQLKLWCMVIQVGSYMRATWNCLFPSLTLHQLYYKRLIR